MPLVIPDDFYEIAMHHQLDGSLRPAVTTCGVFYDGSNFAADSSELGDLWASTIMPSMADVWTYVNFTMRDAEGTVKERAETTEGGTAHTATSPNVTFLVKKTTTQGGRAKRGRMYVPGVSEQDVDHTGVVVGSKVTELQTAFNSYRTGMIAFHFTPVILHNSAIAPTTVSSFIVQTMAATQRRRMRK